MSEYTTCDKCDQTMESVYKFCPSCGHKLDDGVRAVMHPYATDSIGTVDAADSNDSTNSSKLKTAKFTSFQLICKSSGAILLFLAVIVLIWFCWSSYVGYLVRFDKPIPETIFSIDSSFFNLSGDNSYPDIFLIIFTLFGLVKVGFWLIELGKKR